MTITILEYKAVPTNLQKQSAIAILKQDDPLGYRKIEVVLNRNVDVDALVLTLTQQQLSNYYETGKVLSIAEGVQIELTKSAKTVDTFLSIALPFELAYQALLTNTVTIDGLYSAWRPIYDGLVNADKTKIQRITRGFTPSTFTYPEPVTPLESYKLEFNNNMMRFLNIVYSRVGIGDYQA